MKLSRYWIASVVLVMLVSPPALASTTFTYQGELFEAGEPADGLYNLNFALWNTLAGGAQQGADVVLPDVSVVNGVFTVELDFGVPALGSAAGMRWIEVTVEGVPLDPRQPITSTPFSIQTRGIYVDENENVGIGTTTPEAKVHIAGGDGVLQLDGSAPNGFTEFIDADEEQLRINKTNNAGHVLFDLNPKPIDGTSVARVRFFRETDTTGEKVAEFLRGNFSTQISARIGVDGANSYFGMHGGKVGIGTSTPSTSLHVVADDDEGTPIFGDAPSVTGSTYGAFFQNQSSSGTGVFAAALASSGDTYGVYGRSDSTSGTGVYGEALTSSGTTYGVYGRSSSTSGTGVYGRATRPTGVNFGGYFESRSTTGRGVFGEATTVTGINHGVRGTSASSTGRGVSGTATSLSGQNFGGRFVSSSTSGIGALGGASANSGVSYGVIGQSASPDGFDFYANGAGTNYGASSSRRWKSNIVPISDPLFKLAQLRGVYFNWDTEHGGQHDVGMIAEEVGAVMPEIVNYEENGIDAIGMDYSKMTPLLVAAVNALRSETDRLIAEKDDEILELRQQLSELQHAVDRLASNQEKVVAP